MFLLKCFCVVLPSWVGLWRFCCAAAQLTHSPFSLKVTNPIGDAPKRVPMSQHSTQSHSLTSGAPARVLCPANFAQRVPVQPQKPLLSTQKPPKNQTAQQPRPKAPQQATVRPQAVSKSTEKPPQAAAPGNCEGGFPAVTLRMLLKLLLSQGWSWREVLGCAPKQESSTWFTSGVPAPSLWIYL